MGATIDSVLVTGAGVACSLGVGMAAFRAGLIAGKSGVDRPRHAELWPGLEAIAELDDVSLGAALERLPGCSPTFIQRARRSALRGHRSLDWSLITATEAWLDARLDAVAVAPERLGVVVAGSNLAQRYQHDAARAFAESGHADPRYALRFLDTDQMAVLSESFGAQGEGFTVGGASASGTVAIIKAWQLLRLGDLDACLVVGPLADLSPLELRALRDLGALSPGNRGREASRPFDRSRDGFVFGQAAGCLVLERGASARRRGVSAQAEVAGGALRLAAHHSPAPDVHAEAAAMRCALERAGVAPDAVDYVNAHATSSPAGDAAEAAALREVFGADARRPWINSTKGLIGHALHAAGVVECIATLVQLEEGFVHPNANLHDPIDSTLLLAPLEPREVRLSVALSNSFGFGGINASVVLRRS